MIESVIGLLSGGATGLLGTGISFGVDYFKTKQQHQQEVELRRIDLEVARTEQAHAERVVAMEAESTRDQAAYAALEASYQEAGRRWSRGDARGLVFVDVVRGLTRPTLTWGFVALMGAIYFTAAADQADLQERIVQTVLYLASTCVTWWFGARQLAAPKTA